MAIVLGAARLLVEARDSLPGSVKFIFQPAEECPPKGGAKGMINDGVLEHPRVAAAFGLHIWPDLPAGMVGLKYGPIMAAADSFELSIRGKGGHGASPHQTTDALLVTAHAVLALQSIVSRKIDPLESAVLSIGTCRGGTAFNIIAEQMVLEGTTRYLDPALGDSIREEMKRIVENVGRAHGASCHLNYQFGFPPTINDPEMTQLVAQAAGEVLGEERVHWIAAPSMTGEDFAYYLQEVPGCYFWLGTRNPGKGIVHPLHSPKFEIDEEVLWCGTAVLAKVVLSFFYG
jgi:amidohydrolase